MKILLPSLTLAAIGFAPAAHAAEPLFASAPLTEQELDEARGGFTLPGGIQLDIGAIISTSIDGVRVLTSQLNISSSAVTGSVTSTSGATATLSGAGSSSPNVTQSLSDDVGNVTSNPGNLAGTLGDMQVADASGSGTIDTPANVGTGVTVLAPIAPALEGATTVGADVAQTVGASVPALQADGPEQLSSTTVNGNNYLTATVELTDVLVRHSLGDTVSSLVVNTGDNRVIDTQLIVNLRLDNVDPLSIGSAGFRIDALGVDASQFRASR